MDLDTQNPRFLLLYKDSHSQDDIIKYLLKNENALELVKSIYDNKDFFEMANFSSRGPAFRHFKPDVVAPSVDITSCGRSEFYTKLSGTSVATPMIAGFICLMLERFPKLSPQCWQRVCHWKSALRPLLLLYLSVRFVVWRIQPLPLSILRTIRQPS